MRAVKHEFEGVEIKQYADSRRAGTFLGVPVPRGAKALNFRVCCKGKSDGSSQECILENSSMMDRVKISMAASTKVITSMLGEYI